MVTISNYPHDAAGVCTHATCNVSIYQNSVSPAVAADVREAFLPMVTGAAPGQKLTETRKRR